MRTEHPIEQPYKYTVTRLVVFFFFMHGRCDYENCERERRLLLRNYYCSTHTFQYFKRKSLNSISANFSD